MEQLELERNQSLKRMKEKEKKLQQLESKITDMEEDRLTQFKEYQEQQESQKTLFELQIIDLKKRIEELTEKSKQQKKTISKLQSE